MGPLKLKALGPASMTVEEVIENSRWGLALGLKGPDQIDGHLAVAGAGPSLGRAIDELRSWPGQIWGVNGACWELRRQGVSSWFFSVDPKPVVADLIKCAEGAILGAACDAKAFAHPADIRCFDVLSTPRGPTSVTTTPYLAIELGASEVSFFGCECSYEGTTHVYMSEHVPLLTEVECGGELFLTKPELMMQAEFLAMVIRESPSVFHDRSGGFLGALVREGKYDITRISRELEQQLLRQAA